MEKAAPYLVVGLLGLALLVVLGYAAQRGLSELVGGSEALQPFEDEAEPAPVELVVYADPLSESAALPDRFSAALATDALHLQLAPSLYPPAGFVRARLAGGDQRAEDALLRALRGSRAAGASADAVHELFGELLWAEPTRAHCAFVAAAAVDESLPAGARELLARNLAYCPAELARAAYHPSASLPAAGVADWMTRSQLARRGSLTPVEAEALQALAREARFDVALPAARAVLTIEPERGRGILEAAAAHAPPEARGAWLALLAEPPPAPLDLDARLRVPGAEPELFALFASDWGDALPRALVRCAARARRADAEEWWERRACLAALARLDRALARQTARAVSVAFEREEEEEDGALDPDMPLQETARSLARFETAAELRAHLSALGLSVAPDPRAGLARPIDAREALELAGRHVCLPAQAPDSPPRLDELAHRVAHLLSPALEDVRFDQLPAVDDASGVGRIPLDAYARALRHRVEAEDRGLSWDEHAIFGIVNRLARERGSAERVVLVDGGPGVCAVAGSEGALLAAEADGLLTLRRWDVQSPSGAGGLGEIDGLLGEELPGDPPPW